MTRERKLWKAYQAAKREARIKFESSAYPFSVIRYEKIKPAQQIINQADREFELATAHMRDEFDAAIKPSGDAWLKAYTKK